MKNDYENHTDFDQILATRYDNGADYWATPDGRLGIEKPISTLTALMIISELSVPRDHEALQGAAELVLAAIRDDGRVRIAPKGAIYPCHTAHAMTGLCRNGYASHPRVLAGLDYLLADRYEDGGWRCNKFIYGHGPETDKSNPGVTLLALDAFRLAGFHAGTQKVTDLDRAVETLLDHWTVKTPVGPCHYGIGSLFMQVEYPFLRYNLFYYVYVLSFYEKARKDKRFNEAMAALKQKLDNQGRMIVERPNRKLSNLELCKKGQPSAAATARYLEIVQNIASDRRKKDEIEMVNRGGSDDTTTGMLLRIQQQVFKAKPDGVILVKPTEKHQQQAEAFKQEFFDHGETVINGSALLDQMNYRDWLENTRRNGDPQTVRPDWVVAETFLAIREADNQIVGIIDFRHSLNEFLGDYGGHIGYAVRPGERNKGYATAMLRQILCYAKEMGLEAVMLGCYTDNGASRKIIEKCGGILTCEKPYLDGKQMVIYWIKTKTEFK